MPQLLSLIVPAELAGQRLDLALTHLAHELSRARVQRLLDAGCVVLGGREAKPALRLRGGEHIEVTLPDPEPSGLIAQDLPLSVLYEDRDLIVLDKAAGMVVHPARGSPHSTVVNALLHRLGTPTVPGERLGLVHRLDKGTSGCLVVAKTEVALAALQASFKRREVDKVYLALCHGDLPPEGRLDTPYGRHPRDRTRYTSRVESSRRAVTAWRLIEQFRDASLAEVTLHTGRTHQIRVHFSEGGHPLLADATYGGTRREAKLPLAHPVRKAAELLGRQGLHAWKLAFPHPRDGHRVAIEAPWPEDLLRGIEALRLDRGDHE